MNTDEKKAVASALRAAALVLGGKQTFYHLTDKANFKFDSKKVPEDNAIALRERKAPGLFLVSSDNVTRWTQGKGYIRPFLVEIEVDTDLLVAERWGGEMFLPAEHLDKARVTRIIPYDAWLREEFGGWGSTEEWFDTEFDTEAPIPKEEIRKYLFHGWRWKGDVRTMSPAWVKRYKKRVRDYVRQGGTS